MSHAPSKKQFDILQKKVRELEADVTTATELNDKAHSRALFLDDEVAGYKDACGELEAENKRLVAERKTLADRLVRREATIVQQAVRLAAYDHADRDWNAAAAADVEL